MFPLGIDLLDAQIFLAILASTPVSGHWNCS
jgi:hypothetical protein